MALIPNVNTAFSNYDSSKHYFKKNAYLISGVQSVHLSLGVKVEFNPSVIQTIITAYCAHSAEKHELLNQKPIAQYLTYIFSIATSDSHAFWNVTYFLSVTEHKKSHITNLALLKTVNRIFKIFNFWLFFCFHSYKKFTSIFISISIPNSKLLTIEHNNKVILYQNTKTQL